LKSVFLPLDQNGNPVHAHGGHILRENDKFYWIGEDRTGRNKVSCYVSTDLMNWSFSNHILTIDSTVAPHYVRTYPELDIPEQQAEIGQGCNIERPKVLYNEKTKKYVMWMHWERPSDYSQARCAVAVCDTIDGDYTYLGSFNPIGHMSRDCTLFKDDDGTAYFVSAARDNDDLNIYKLSDDYLSIDRLVHVLWPGQQREAPTLFKRNGLYYMLTSGCTGWDPNQSAYAYSTSIAGDWSLPKELGDETTYRSQPTCVIPLHEKNGSIGYWYLGDRWGGSHDDYFKSKYVLLPLKFVSDKEIILEWLEEVDLPTSIIE